MATLSMDLSGGARDVSFVYNNAADAVEALVGFLRSGYGMDDNGIPLSVQGADITGVDYESGAEFYLAWEPTSPSGWRAVDGNIGVLTLSFHTVSEAWEYLKRRWNIL